MRHNEQWTEVFALLKVCLDSAAEFCVEEVGAAGAEDRRGRRAAYEGVEEEDVAPFDQSDA
jgi:hypothetical protein